MHYPDESYVRKYTRKTVTNRLLKWQGRAVLDAMLGEFDRAGIFELAGDPVECIVAVTDIPEDVVRFALEKLVVTKTWIVTASAIVWPTYVEAQTCAKSDRVRQSELRKRRATQAATVAPRHDDEPEQRESEPPSRAVTPCHAPSRAVTPSLGLTDLEPTFSDPDRAGAREENESGFELGPEPELAPVPTRTAIQTRCFPRGWRWSTDTTAVARAAGVSDLELQTHVNYWTTRKWAVPIDVDDLDFELQLTLPAIVQRRSKAPGEVGASAGASRTQHLGVYAFRATDEHTTFCKAKGLDLRLALDAYRRSGRPEKLGTIRANEDFMQRLEHWAETGEFIPTGPLARRTARGAA